jgi:Pectate lyase superfamily protein
VPWTEYQAEDGQTNAQILGPSRQKWDANHIEAEAIGRKAVRLNKTGDYVSIKTTQPANALVLRYSIPDAPGGGGIDATIGLYVNGVRVKSLPLTSRYSWSYKGGTIGDPNVDKPAEQPHTFFDEARVLLDNIPVGSTVMFKRDAQDNAAFYVIDLIDMEQAPPPLAMPAGFTSVTQFGINPDDGKDHGNTLLTAMRSTQKLWFPPGNYKLETITGGNVGLDNPGIEIRGAGMWHTNLRGRKALFFCYGATAKCVFGDFSISGESKARAEESEGVQKAFAGPMGRNSLIENVWIEHVVGAIWVGNDPPYQTEPTQFLTIRNCRIRNTYADGINFDNGTSNSTVENCHMRNVGDDAAVVWSLKWTDWVREKTFQLGPNFISPEARNAPDQGQAVNNTFRNITVQMPWRANCFAAYGGSNNVFENSVCEDVLTYPGILIDNEFSPYPFGPKPTVFRNISLIRAGGPMFLENTANPWQHGALKFYMREGSVNDVLVENVDIIDPTYAGIEFRGFGTAFVPPGERFEPNLLRDADNASFRNITLRNINITNAGTYGIEVIDSGGRGQVNFEGVVVKGSAKGPLKQDTAPNSFFIRGPGNAGW